MLKLSAEDGESFTEGLLSTTGTESFDGLTWHKTFEKNGSVYLLAMNCDTETKTIQCAIPSAFVKPLIGDADIASLKTGVLSLRLEPNAIYFLTLTDGSETGIYKENVLYTTLQSGEFDVRNAESAALYEICGGTKELILYGKSDTIELQLIAGHTYELKLFSLDNTLRPLQDSIKLTR